MEDRPVTQEFTLERSGGQPMKILEVTPAEPFLKTEVSPLVGSGRYKVAVTATMDTPLGQKSVVVTVRTDIVQSDSVTLVMVVTRGIVATPPVLFLGSVEREPKAPAQTTLTLARRTVPFHITGVAVDDPKLRSTLRTVQDGQQYQISVSYAGGWEPGLVRKTLTVTTDDPRQREIEVPVQAIVERPTPPLAAAAAR